MKNYPGSQVSMSKLVIKILSVRVRVHEDVVQFCSCKMHIKGLNGWLIKGY